MTEEATSSGRTKASNTIDAKEPEPARMALWESWDKTDPAYTKQFDKGTFSGTSIHPVWQYRKMTEAFGPCGVGWGYSVVRDDFVDARTIYGEDPDTKARVALFTEKLHICHVEVWYLTHSGQKGTVLGVGTTPFTYQSKRGQLADSEYAKKSLTDALTNAFSRLGIGADVRAGMFDDPNYLTERGQEADLERAADKDEEKAKQLAAFVEWYEEQCRFAATAVRLNELMILYKRADPRIQREGTEEQQAAYRAVVNQRKKELADAAEKHADAEQPEENADA